MIRFDVMPSRRQAPELSDSEHAPLSAMQWTLSDSFHSLAPDAQFLDQVPVRIQIGFNQIIKQTAPLTNQLQQPSS